MKKKNKFGRPTAITEQTLQKLEWAFKLGATDKEACNNAGISPQTLYNYQLKNPDFLEQKEAFKATPVFKARKALVDALGSDPYLALKYLEKKLPEEFGRKSEFKVETKPPVDIATLVKEIEERNKAIRGN